MSAVDSMLNKAGIYRAQYRKLIQKNEIECPEPSPANKKGKRGLIKKSKSRNLLEQLRDYGSDTRQLILRANSAIFKFEIGIRFNLYRSSPTVLIPHSTVKAAS
jgi:hypothetical protein